MLKKIILNSSVQIVGRALSLVISIVIAGILTRQLGTSGYGNYVFISAYATLLATIANWGTNIIGVRELSRTNNKKKLFKNLIVLRLVFSILTVIGGLMAIILLPVFQDIKIISTIVLPLVFVSTFESTSYIIYQTLVRMDLKSAFQTLSQILFLGFTLIFLKYNWQIAAPLAGYLIAKLITGSISFSKALKLIPDSKASLVKWKKIKKLFWATMPLGIQLILFTGYDQAVDSFIIKSYLGSTQVGLYGLAYKIYSNLVLPAYYLNSTILPIISKNNAKSRKSLKNAVGLTILGLIILVPLTIIFSDFAVNLISGSEYSQSGQILKILAISLIFAYFNHLGGFILIAKDRQIESLIIGLIALGWNLILNLVFIPNYGIFAAAWITVSTEALVTIITGWRLIWCYNKRK